MGNARNIAFWVVLFLLILALFNLFSGSGNTLQSRELSYSEFVQSVEAGQVSSVTLDGEQVRFRRGETDYVAIKPEDATTRFRSAQNSSSSRASRPSCSACFRSCF